MISWHTFKPLVSSVAFSFLFFTIIQAQPNQSMIQKYTLRPTIEILRDLYFLKQRERSGEEIIQPLITIMPSNKLPISGFLIDFKDDKDQRGVVLELAGSNNVAFIELHWISGVAIQDADKVAHLLMDLTVNDIKTTATRLEVKTKLKNQSEKLAQKIAPINFVIADEDFPASGQQLYMAALVITDVAMALIEIAKTDMGKESITESIKTISIKKGNQLEVQMANGILTISSDFSRSYTTNAARNMLIEKIYNIL